MDRLRDLSVSRLWETFTMSHPLMALGAAVLCLSVVYTLVSITYEPHNQRVSSNDHVVNVDVIEPS